MSTVYLCITVTRSTVAMASRYLFKVEYAKNRFCSFFVNIVDLTDYSFFKQTNDIRVLFSRRRRRDYVNLSYGDMKTCFLKCLSLHGKLVPDRDYVTIQLKVSELDSTMGMQKQLRHEVPDMKPPQKHVKPVVVDDDDDSDSRIAVSKTKSRQTIAEKGHKTNRSLDSTFFTAADDETSETAPSPLQRYINKLEENVESQQQKVSLMKNKLHTVDEKLQLVKSNQIGEGSMCSNCRLRLGHTTRNCSLYKYIDVLSCGVEKFHQN